MPGLLASASTSSPFFTQYAVLPLKLHEISQRAERHQIQRAAHVHARRSRFGQTRVEFRHEKERHPHARQRRAWAVRQLGIAQHRGVGKLLGRKVMVGHHHVHAEFAGPRNGRSVGNAAVHGEQHGRALLRELLHALRVHAVAFFPPVGQMPQRLKAVMPEHLQHQRSAGHAVGVVIAPDGQLFSCAKPVGQHLRGLFHAGPQFRPGQVTKPGRKIFRQLIRSLDAAQPEQLRQTGRNAAAFGRIVKGNRNGRAVPACTEYPVFAHRLSTLPGVVVLYRSLPR